MNVYTVGVYRQKTTTPLHHKNLRLKQFIFYTFRTNEGTKFKMGCGVICVKYLMFFFNVLFAVSIRYKSKLIKLKYEPKVFHSTSARSTLNKCEL